MSKPHPPSESPALVGGAHFPAFAAKRSSLPPGTRGEILCVSLETTRICPQLPPRSSGRERV